jgi:DNA processing protein
MPGGGSGLSGRGRGGDAVWWMALAEIEGVGAATMLRLARTFGSPEQALAAPLEELVTLGGLTRQQAEQAAQVRDSVERRAQQLEALRQQGIATVVIGTPEYPASLLDLRSPPPLLYLRGAITPEDARAVAVVGTRQPDREGRRLARHFARELAARGFTIVSGLARGIDSAGHRGALSTKDGRTIAVLGSGLLRIYPPENTVLAAQLSRRGAVLSEVPPDTEVDRRLLLARDRIQAGLSRAVIVVRAHRQCGSIVTAHYAAQCGRLLLGVPAEEDPFAGGWQRLQELGARPIAADCDLDALAAEIDAWQPPAEQRSLL